MDTHTSPSPPSSSFRPPSPTKDDLKPNAHPYPIKTHSTAALTRSTSGWGLAHRAAPLHPHPVPRCPLAGAAKTTRAGWGAGPASAAGPAGHEQKLPRMQERGRSVGTAAAEAMDARTADGAPGQRGVERGGGVGGEAKCWGEGVYAHVGRGDGGDGDLTYPRSRVITLLSVPRTRIAPLFLPLHIPHLRAPATHKHTHIFPFFLSHASYPPFALRLIYPSPSPLAPPFPHPSSLSIFGIHTPPCPSPYIPPAPARGHILLSRRVYFSPLRRPLHRHHHFHLLSFSPHLSIYLPAILDGNVHSGIYLSLHTTHLYASTPRILAFIVTHHIASRYKL